MKYLLTNPKDGAPIDFMGLTLNVGKTKEFSEEDASKLVGTYDFLVLEVKQPKKGNLGAAQATSIVSSLFSKLLRQEKSKADAEAAKYCPNCKQLLPTSKKEKVVAKPKSTPKVPAKSAVAPKSAIALKAKK